MSPILTYDLRDIPDCSHHRLLMMCRGNVRERIFLGFEQLLRMVSAFRESQLAIALRYRFDPLADSGSQNRLRLQLALKFEEARSMEVARQLVEVGPISEFYSFSRGKSLDCLEISNFAYACEIVRREDRVDSHLPRELNRYVPAAGFYYCPIPFEIREENDYAALDALLSWLKEPCAIELLATPVSHAADLQAHGKYIRQLMAINGYGEDIFLGSTGGALSAQAFDDARVPGAAVLEEVRKRDPLADEILREQQELNRILRQPQLLFSAKIMAQGPETAAMVASVVAEGAFANGKYRLLSYGSQGDAQEPPWMDESLEDARNMRVSLHAGYADIWGQRLPETWAALRRLPHLATVDELKGLFRFPVGGSGSPRCIRKSTDPDPRLIERESSILIGHDLEAGEVDAKAIEPQTSNEPAPPAAPDLDRLVSCPAPAKLEMRVPIGTLAKHVFISGVPGSGKTTAVFNILVQLYRHGIPFLVIEPAKTEYRFLKVLGEHPDPSIRKMAQEVRLLTPGNERIAPFRFNPLAYSHEVSADEHIGQILACFEAAMPMGGPLQALIAEAVEAVYEEQPVGQFPRMLDLLKVARRIVESKSYEGEVRSNLVAAIEVRLGLLTRRSVGRLFASRTCIPSMNELLSHPTIIEMDYLPQDQACLLTLFLLAALREEIAGDPARRQGGLHHVTVIEEAHNIVGRTGEAKASEEIADPKAFAAQYIARMLAELRALGEGLIIADQLPSTVAPVVVKNTGTKIAHRLVSNDDREELGGAMLMGEMEIQETARLSPGEAYIYTESLHGPRRVRCLNANAYLNPHNTRTPVGREILPHLEEDEHFWECAKLHALEMLSDLIDLQKQLSADIGECMDWLKRLSSGLAEAREIDDPQDRETKARELLEDINSRKAELNEAVVGYVERSLRPNLQACQAASDRFPAVQEVLQKIRHQHDSVLMSDYEATLEAFAKTKQPIEHILEKGA